MGGPEVTHGGLWPAHGPAKADLAQEIGAVDGISNTLKHLPMGVAVAISVTGLYDHCLGIYSR